MTKPRYKTASFQKLYDSLLIAAKDKSSELYYNGLPHRGASHRCAFWDGYAGLCTTSHVIPNTLTSVCFAAGKTFAKTKPGVRVEDAVWTPGITKQGEQ